MGKKGRYNPSIHGKSKDPVRAERQKTREERSEQLKDPNQMADYVGQNAVSLLHQFAQKQKYPNPRYSRAKSPLGTFRMRVSVVLSTNPHDEKPPIESFITDESYPSFIDAKQHCATAALAGLIGERQLHLILPSPLNAYFQICKERFERIASATAIRETKIARRVLISQEIESYLRTLPEVRLSTESRRLVESAIRQNRESQQGQIDEHGGGGQIQLQSMKELRFGKNELEDELGIEIDQEQDQGSGSASTSEVAIDEILGSETRNSNHLSLKLVKNKVKSQGFSAKHCDRAVKAVTSNGFSLSNDALFDSVMDYLVLNVPEDELPKKLRPGADIEFVVDSIKMASKSKSNPAELESSSSSSHAFVDMLERFHAMFVELESWDGENDNKNGVVNAELFELQWSIAKVKVQFAAAENDKLQHYNFQNQIDRSLIIQSSVTHTNTTAAAAASDIIDDEILALESIYADKFSYDPVHSLYVVKMEVDGVCCGDLVVHVGCGYPLKQLAFFQGNNGTSNGETIMQIVNYYLARLCIENMNTIYECESVDLGGVVAPAFEMISTVSELLSDLVSLEFKKPPAFVFESSGITGKGKGKGKGKEKERESEEVNPRMRVNRGGKKATQRSRPKLNLRNLPHDQKQANLKRAAKYLDFRQSLPIYKYKDAITDLINENAVSIIRAETGSGKSTQVAQFLASAAHAHAHDDPSAYIVCTQPRRVAAVSLAMRVSAEQGSAVGQVVGYHVRGDKSASDYTRIMYCTTGILIRQLLDDEYIGNIEYLILDEVHERSIEVDFLLSLLHNKYLRSKSKKMKMKIILMSATIELDEIRDFFSDIDGGVGVLDIPGRTFPVAISHLDDFAGHFRLQLQSKSKFDDGSSSDHYGRGQVQTALQHIEEMQGDFKVPHEYIVDLICNRKLPLYKSTVILVFLPGAAEISQLKDMLMDMGGSSMELDIHVLHSSVSIEEQKLAFVPNTNPRRRKIILATNIAETSVTIPNVDCVIDSGFMREIRMQFGISRLCDVWISKQSASQRAGRAGRTKPGLCYRMYTKRRFLDGFASAQLPEIQRIPLDQLCMSILYLKLGKPSQFLDASSCLSPPNPMNVQNAMKRLLEHGAVDKNDRLTALGVHLAKMPVDVVIGKCLIHASLLGCVGPMLSICASLSEQSPFYTPLEQREEANMAKKRLANGYRSDFMALLNAYDQWKACSSRNERRNFCISNFLSQSRMQRIDSIRNELASSLRDLGFLASSSSSSLNANRILTSALCGGLFPNICRIMRPKNEFVNTISGAAKRDRHARELRLRSRDGQLVWIHPSSVNFSTISFESQFIAYLNAVETSKVYVRDTMMVTPYALLLFGGPITVSHSRGIIKIGVANSDPETNRALVLRCPARTAVLFSELRKEIEKLLLAKMVDPAFDIANTNLMESVRKLLVNELSS